MSDEAVNTELSTLKSELSLMTYRLGTIEAKLDESLEQLSNKIDILLDRYTETKEKQALVSQALEQSNEKIKTLEKKISVLEKDLVGVRITMAEKLVYGGLGGGLVAGLAQLVELAFN